MRVALVHDWITGLRGGERCLEAFLTLYPDADIFTLLHIPGTTTQRIDSRVKQSSFIQRIPNSKRLYRHLLPLYPFAINGFDLSDYDLVISLSHAAAKNVRIRSEKTRHLSFCFTPMRYIWDQSWEYFGSITPLLWPLISALRLWDKAGAEGVDKFAAISRFIAARIRLFYGRRSTVIHPPVETSWIRALGEAENLPKGEAFLMAGALVPYKKPEVAVHAFNKMGEPLWITGDGPELEKLRAIAGPTIKFIGRVSDEELAERYVRCRALIFPGIEDFGMIPVECMAAGRPVIGLDAGGLRDTIKGVRPWLFTPENSGKSPKSIAELAANEATGVFIRRSEDPVSSLMSSVKCFLELEGAFRPSVSRLQAERFDVRAFSERWQQFAS